MTKLKEIVEDLNVSICDIETLKLENPGSVDLDRAVGQIKAARASVIAFSGKYQLKVEVAK